MTTKITNTKLSLPPILIFNRPKNGGFYEESKFHLSDKAARQSKESFMNPKISVCIPVFRSEKMLAECLASVQSQTFRDFEVIIADDGSDGKDEKGRNAKKIAKEFSKLFKKENIHLEYIRHSSNLGLVETRRSLVGAAQGDFIAMLDSDDIFLPDTLKSLFSLARESGADIVHGKAQAFLTSKDKPDGEKRLQKIQAKIELTSEKIIEGKDIRKSWLVDRSHHGYLWGKLIKKELYQKAFEKIPFLHGTMAEDLIQYFFITSLAKCYIPLNQTIYRYRADSGITSDRIITTEEDWIKIAQTADIFNGIFAQIESGEVSVTDQEKSALASLCRNHLANNIVQLKFVSDGLKERAREILIDHWGENFVKKAESFLKSQNLTEGNSTPLR